MKNNLNTIIFAFVLAIVCSLILTAASKFTEPYRIANEKAEKVRNFLSALDVPLGPNADSKKLLKIFDENIRVKSFGDLSLYEYVPAGSVDPVSIAVPFKGPGLWAMIYGVMAFEPDLQTIRGIRFYKHEETPGLGGEISSEWFVKEFIGKKIVSYSGDPGFKITKPGISKDNNSVDGITGATMTSDFVQKILDDLAKAIGKERSNYVK